MSVGLCLAHMAADKRPWLGRLGVNAAWPMSGKPREIFTDNATEFKSEALQRGRPPAPVDCQCPRIALAHPPDANDDGRAEWRFTHALSRAGAVASLGSSRSAGRRAAACMSDCVIFVPARAPKRLRRNHS
ncbi:hypothetical protein E1286_43670 [Nonomuraea terrae]|uniref:Uncharacterized protein n=1 Tax=Nonomuraea terrae TaxID=2530383 RepID=A0A4R4XN13_9ACTN|nr:hypothetical protein [Nonomuraea terrae]TDD32400.1 hypothetical protein E1286_43670 [Nonomuraea terrae]